MQGATPSKPVPGEPVPDEPEPGAPFRPERSLRFWLIAAAVLALVAVGAGAAATVVIRGHVADTTSELNDHLRPAQTEAQRLLTAYVDEETGQRGFVLTGDETFLQPYHAGVRRAAAIEQRLTVMLRYKPQARAHLHQVRAAARIWRSHAAKDIREIRSGRAASVHTVAHQRLDKRLFDSLRDRLDALNVEVDRMVGAQLARLSSAQHEVEVAMVVAMVLAGLALVTTVALLHFALTRPLGRLVDQLGAVSRGDYDRAIEASSPEEVRRIAEAAETMRVSVVDRSAELVSAQHQLSVQNERQRVAADLHDTTIQRLFALGLKLSALASQRAELAGTLNALIDEADEIIRELRQTIFEMNGDVTRAGEEPAPTRSPA